MSIKNTVISCIASLTLITTGMVGGMIGTQMERDQARAAAAAEAQVAVESTLIRALEVVDAQAQQEAQTAITQFQPTIDAATALVASSDGKASAEARNALNDLVTDYESQIASIEAKSLVFGSRTIEIVQPADPGAHALSAVTSTIDEATPAIAAASKTVTDEVAAWQAEQDRIAAEEAARQAAEQQRSNSGNNGGGSSNSNGGGSSNGSSGGGNGGGSNGGGSSDGRAWAEGVIRSIAPGVGIQWGYGGNGSYAGKFSRGSNTISLSDSIADRSGYAYSILVHEATHAGPQRGSCYDTWWGSHFNSDAERFVQAYTLKYFGTTVNAYAYPTQADLDAIQC